VLILKINRFEDLEIWQEARALCQFIFDITSKEPFNKDYRFRDQIRASSGSIMDNVAEGYERSGNKEFIQFLSIAKGSCGETRSQCYRAMDFGYIDEETLEELIDQTTNLNRKIAGFMSYLKKSTYKGTKYHPS
jgi:four helix bundle protein